MSQSYVKLPEGMFSTVHCNWLVALSTGYYALHFKQAQKNDAQLRLESCRDWTQIRSKMLKSENLLFDTPSSPPAR